MQAYLVDVFTAEPGKGNPAAVVLDGTLSHVEMGAIAARLGVETTFVDGLTLRYYQPSGAAMTLCGHGTLAALAVMGRQGSFAVSAPMGELPVSVGEHLLGLGMPPATLGEELGDEVRAAVAAAMGIEPGLIDGPVQVAGAGRPKLMVPLRSLEALDELRPDYDRLADLCATVGATGVYPFTLEARAWDSVADARHFPAGAGIDEDPVTGVAAVALAWYLWRHGMVPGCVKVKIDQGHAMGRPGRVTVQQQGGGFTWIFGEAVRHAEPVTL